MIREKFNRSLETKSGFTIFELLISIFIISILLTIGVPAFSKWIPDYRLKCKANELHADMHLAKVRAIRENNKYRIVFSPTAGNSYSLIRPDGVIEKTVTLPSSGSNDNISFGSGAATKNATRAGGAPPGDGISYTGNILTFNPGGTGSAGFVYLQNRNSTSYAVGSLSSGVISIKKWDSAGSSWR